MTIRQTLGLCVFALLTCAAGCGSNSQTSETDAANNSAMGEQNASLRRSIDLVGIWLGHATLDREGLRQHLASLTDVDERARIEGMAKSLESVSIAMEFRPDSTMEVEVEILPENSPPIRENTTGTWKVVSSDATSITVLCTENYEGGRIEEETLRYEIAADHDHITTVVPVGEELRPFHPRFEFERRVETKVAEQPTNGETTLR